MHHMIPKMRPVDKDGSHIGMVFNGSPLFTDTIDVREAQPTEVA